MVEQPLKIVWDNEAKEYLKKTIQYIRLDSPQNADKVAAAIKEWLKILTKYPTKYPPDKYRITNPDNKFRALTIYNFRISYFIGENEIRIVRFRHTKQKPNFY